MREENLAASRHRPRNPVKFTWLGNYIIALLILSGEIMNRILAVLLLLTAGASAQTATITGTLSDVTGGGVGNNAYLLVELYGCGGNRANFAGGTAVQSKKYSTDANGAIKADDGTSTATIVRNDQITCGNVLGGTSYYMTPFVDGQPSGPRLQFQINSGTFNWNTASPVTAGAVGQNPVSAVITNPSGVQTVGGFPLADGVGFQSADGTVSTGGYSWISDTSSRWYRAGAGDFRFSLLASDLFRLDSSGATLPPGFGWCWGSSGVTAKDTCAWRVAPGSFTFGNSTPGDFSGTIKATTINAVTGLQINGVPLAAIHLSNGVTGSGSICLNTSCNLIAATFGTATGNFGPDTGRFGAGGLRWQQTATNAPAVLTLMPAGNSNNSELRLYNASDPANTGSVDNQLVGAIFSFAPLAFGTGTLPTTVDLSQFPLTKTAVTRVAPGLFSALPACAAGTEGDMGSVTDSTTNAWGATVTGTGANHVLAYCDGTNWTVAGK